MKNVTVLRYEGSELVGVFSAEADEVSGKIRRVKNLVGRIQGREDMEEALLEFLGGDELRKVWGDEAFVEAFNDPDGFVEIAKIALDVGSPDEVLDFDKLKEAVCYSRQEKK